MACEPVAQVDGSAPGWWLSLYPTAGEGGGTFVSSLPPKRDGAKPGEGSDPERSLREAVRRARGQMRRYCVANRLNRLGTLTYGGEGCHDGRQARVDLGVFFRRLRRGLGGEPFPYLWVPEWHKSGHGLHAHFGVGRYVRRGLIEAAWGHGFVHIKLLGDLPVGSGSLAEARQAAGYLSKYVGKDFGKGDVSGLHRYEAAQGFQPEKVRLWGRSRAEVIEAASAVMGRQPCEVWSSESDPEWAGPPAMWVAFP